MALHIDIGGGKTVDIDPPQRGQFTDNLGGAVQFSLANTVYKIMEVMGAGLGAFVGSFGVKFLERLEPELVHYAKPLLDLMLDQKDLEPHLRLFLEQLRSPQHFAAGALLGGLVSNAGGSVMSSMLGALTAPLTYGINRMITPARLGPGDAWGMNLRGLLTDLEAVGQLHDQGYNLKFATAYRELVRGRPNPGELITGAVRGLLSWESAKAQIHMFGYSNEEAEILHGLARQYLGGGDYVAAWKRGLLDDASLEKRLTELGIGLGDQAMLKALGRQYLAPTEYIQSWLRGDMDETTLRRYLTDLRLDLTDQEMAKRLAHWIPGAQDLIQMAVREAWDENVATQFGTDQDFPAPFAEWLAKAGGSAEWAKRYWRAHWQLPSPQMGYEMFHRGVIDKATLETLLRTADYTPFWRPKMVAIAYNPFTRVDARRMYGLGVLDRAGVKRAYLDLGYDDFKAEKMTEFTVRYEDENGASTKQNWHDLTQAQVIKAYTRGIYDRAEASAALEALRYHPEDAEFLLDLADAEKAIGKIPDYSDEYRRDTKNLVEKAYGTALIGREAAKTMLHALGMSDADSEYSLSAVEYAMQQADTSAALDVIGKTYAVRAISKTDVAVMVGKLNIPATQQERLLKTWDLERDVRSRRLTESQYRSALKYELIDVEGYREAMRGLGYTEADIKLLVGMLPTPVPPGLE
jgi:hypothetical protein